MTPEQIAALATPLAWPVVTILVLIVYADPLHTLLRRLAASLTIKTVKLKTPAGEMELTVEQAKTTLDELLEDVTQMLNELGDSERLFDEVIVSNGTKSVLELCPNFQRSTSKLTNADHERLRKLRDCKLVRPLEGHTWDGHKHPVATRFGELVVKLRNSAKPVKQSGAA